MIFFAVVLTTRSYRTLFWWISLSWITSPRTVVKLCYVIDPVGAQMAFGHSWFAEEYKYAA